MNFAEAEAKFRELQARVQRGEPISRAEYEDQVSQLSVQDDRGTLWEINPRTGKWMYFDGAQWVGGTPPGHDNSTVMPMPTANVPPPPPPTPAPPPQPTPAPASPKPYPSATARPAIPVGTAPRAPTSPTAKPSGTASAPVSPEAVPTYGQAKKTTKPAAPVKPGESESVAGGAPTRAARRSAAGSNREWIPLAIGAVVLLACAALLYVGGNFALGLFGAKPTTTPTRSIALATATALPTIVRLPTQPPPTFTPAPVLAKVIERTVNVRAQPSTKAQVISSLKKDNQITLVGKSEDGKWYQVNIAGSTKPGWVFGETLQIVSGDPNALPGPAQPTSTATKSAAAPQPAQPTPTLTPIGAPTAAPKP